MNLNSDEVQKALDALDKNFREFETKAEYEQFRTEQSERHSQSVKSHNGLPVGWSIFTHRDEPRSINTEKISLHERPNVTYKEQPSSHTFQPRWEEGWPQWSNTTVKIVVRGKNLPLKRLAQPKSDNYGGFVPDGFKLEVHQSSVVMVGPGYDPTVDPKQVRLGQWPKRHFDGWVVCDQTYTRNTPQGEAVIKRTKISNQSGMGKSYAYSLTINRLQIPGSSKDGLWNRLETAKQYADTELGVE